MTSIIVAYNYKRVIGNEGKIPWHLPEDLKRFKELTMGCPIIMGRKTHESIGRVLPGRMNIIVSRNKDYIPLGPFKEPVFVVQSLERAIQVAESEDKEIFIIGGEQIYKEAVHLANRIYVTLVKNSLEGDTHFPEVPGVGEWKVMEEIQNETHDYVTFERKS